MSDAEEVNYATYLAVDGLLSLQHPRSQPEHSDELLFIVVHQSSELWFKAILHDIDGLVAAFGAGDAGRSLWHLQRINGLMRIVLTQLSSLDTLPPQHFAAFRSFLGTSSGFQSVQFRAIEAASGRRDEHFMKALAIHDEVPEAIARALSRPGFEDLFLALLSSSNATLEDLYQGPGPSLLFFIAEGLLEYEQIFAQWRFKHVQLVERVIGPLTVGTGGSLGSRYLLKTLEQRFFPRLWAVRGQFFGKPLGSL